MLNNPKLKFTLANTLFFGIVGSLIAGVIPTIFFSKLLFDPWMTRTDILFAKYVVGSISLGFIPASICGFIYSKMYEKQLLHKGCVDFWQEIRLGLLSSFTVMFTICFLSMIALTLSAFSTNSTNEQLLNLLGFCSLVALILIAIGVVAGVSCANLIRQWNQKTAIRIL